MSPQGALASVYKMKRSNYRYRACWLPFRIFIRARCKLRGLLVRDLEPRLRSLGLANFSEDPITHRKQ